eukprot:scaffold1619_cov143-Cylindrotheca_fusiformis.AAC.2
MRPFYPLAFFGSVSMLQYRVGESNHRARTSNAPRTVPMTFCAPYHPVASFVGTVQAVAGTPRTSHSRSLTSNWSWTKTLKPPIKRRAPTLLFCFAVE